ncbi:hypothetical protein ACP4OV_018472 [Aristida adscensionis]
MVSEGAAASRRPPLAPPPKRRSEGSAPDVLTYKRRRRAPASSKNSAAAAAAAAAPEPSKGPRSMVANGGNSQQAGHPAPPPPLARHWKSWRETLEGFLQSPSLNQGSGGIQGCIREALRYNGCQPLQQNGCPVTQGNLGDGQGAAQGNPSKENNGALAIVEDGTSLAANKAMCMNALFDILVSEKFALLCDLLAGPFLVNKLDKVIDLEKVDAKMRDGSYAQNPTLFDLDIKQMWEKFEQVGREMAGLANSLSVISRASYQKQVSGISEFDVTEHRTEKDPCDSGHSTMPKRTGTSGQDGVQTCKDCGKTADSEGRIICDGCEAAYHVSCLKIAMEDVPLKWYCAACTGSAIVMAKNKDCGVSHEDCNVCDWLEFVKPVEQPELVSGTDLADETQESAVACVDEDSEPDLSTTALSNLCKHCGTCEDEDKKFLVCGHPYCSYKFYHIRCMKESQLAREKQKNRACWYCPSCLCRGCFKDKDDDYTVLCDGCDEAYHIYCMDPPRTSIPKGKWYCEFCVSGKATGGLQRYEKVVIKSLKPASNAKKS